MAEFSVIYTEEALQDMLNISDYHFEKVGEASALRAVAELQDHIEKLSLFLRIGEEHPDTYLNALGFRKLVHNNHIVIYRIDQSQVVIERIVWASLPRAAEYILFNSCCGARVGFADYEPKQRRHDGGGARMPCAGLSRPYGAGIYRGIRRTSACALCSCFRWARS